MTAKPKKISRLKLLFLVALFCVVAAALLAVSYHIFYNYHKVQHYDDAIIAINNKNWTLAEKILKECIQADPNDENAVAKLAMVCEKLDNWSEAGVLWAHAARLNEFKPEYTESMLAAFLKGGNAGWLQFKLEKMRPLTSDRYILMLAFAYGNQGKIREGIAEFEKIQDQELLSSPLGRLTAFYIDPDRSMTPEKIAELEALSEGDEAAAFYAQTLLADYYLNSGKIADAEKYLLKTLSFNPLTGSLNLAHFYYLTGKVDESLKLYKENANELAPLGAMRYGEALATANQPDEILALAQKHSLGSKQHIQAGYYLEALVAFMKKDDALLAEKLSYLGGGYPNTPTAHLLLLYNGVKQRNPDTVIRHITQLYAMKSNVVLKNNCTNMVKSFALDLLKKNELDAAARISLRMLELNENDIVFTRAAVTSAFRDSTLSRRDLEDALKLYPNDPGLLAIAADFYLQNGDFAAARKYAEKQLQGIPGNIPAQLQIITAMEGQKKIQEAARTFTELYHKTPADRKLLTMYLAFCSQHKLTEELTDLKTFLDANSYDGLRIVVNLAGAEKAYADNNREKMYEMLMRIVDDPSTAVATSENANILFRTATLLGEADYLPPAIAVFERLLKLDPNNALCLVNMSELYAVQNAGKDDKATATALELARRAYYIDSNSPIVREYYAMRLFESKKYAETERLLFSAVQEGNISPRALDAWKSSIENVIRTLAAQNEASLCITYCQSLLGIFPDNQLAKDTLDALELARQKAEEEAAAEAARQD